MDSTYIIKKVNEYLHVATGELSDWLSKLLPKATNGWWDECVLDKLSFNQREMAQSKGFAALTEFDLAALLRIADKNWYTLRNFAYLPTSERECVKSMQGVRNNWAHCGRSLPPKEAIVRDLEIMLQFFEQLSVSDDHIAGLMKFKTEVEMGSAIIDESNADASNRLDAVWGEDGSEEIKERSMVYLTGDPATKGMVFSVETIGNEKKYDVFVNGSLRTFYSGQIAIVDDTPKYHWVDASTLQSYLSAYQINNPSSGNLYSLNSARIDFVPYQFRPALKLVKADEPRILIADSVGVGKTIEAGLIIKELEARGDLENVMIICPKPLVSERKWELEMKRFDEEFIPLNGPQLRQIISDTDRDGEWPSRFNRTIVPYSILDSRIFDGDDSRKNHAYGLSDLDPAPHFDLVIIDEAHHIRNGSLDKEKAYAYKCVKYICDHADAVVMLTATPLQTGDDDLFTLLNVLRPDVVLDKATFRLMSEPNAYVSRCAHIVRAAEEGWTVSAIEELENLQSTRWGDNVIAQNPLYSNILERLSSKEVSREDRVRLITDIESLHSFNTMLNRTRRKDIQDFCVRRSHTLETSFTPEQRNLHNELLRFEHDALSVLHNPRSVPFMMSTIRRQAASCIFGLAPYIRDIINRRFSQMADDPEFDIDADYVRDADAAALVSLAEHILYLADNLPVEDPKFNSVCEIVKQKQLLENNKIILFSTFRHTLAYLKSKFISQGVRVEQIDGSVKDETRCALRERFMLPKSDPNALDMLLFTEVGSEGLDYQFCDIMINYDLPWNPMRIEQRIGRIDRRGQHSEVVNIYNVITQDTVDADIYYRCLNRIGVFERSIGECEEILGEIGSKVEKIAFNATLTDDERRAKLEQMADNEIRKVQELSRLEDEEKGLFGFDLSSYTVSKEIQEAESPWLTPKSIQQLIERYLAKRLGGDSFIIGDGSIKTLRLSQPNRLILREDLKKLPDSRNEQKRRWDVFLKGKKHLQKITFDSEAAEKDRSALFITTVHPLVKQAARYFATNEPAYISLQYADDSITPGTYAFSIFAWNYIGINPHFKLVAVCEQNEIASDFANILQSATTIEFSGKPPVNKWKTLESKHFALWQEEKQVHTIAAHSVANYKIESIESSFSNRKRILDEQIQAAYDEKIIRMRQSELENATERYQTKIDMLKQQEQQADIHVTLIANGIITIT